MLFANNDLEKFYKQLLISSSCLKNNEGSILGIDEETNRLLISYTFTASIFSYEMFKTILLNFVDLIENNTLNETIEYDKYY